MITSLSIQPDSMEHPSSSPHLMNRIATVANQFDSWHSLLPGAGQMNVLLTPELSLSRSLQRKMPNETAPQLMSVVTAEITEIP